MNLPNKKKLLILISAFLFAGLAAGFSMFFGRSGPPGSSQRTREADFPESFAFFNLSANTSLTDGLKKEFRIILGMEAVSEDTPIDLEIHGRGFLSRHFDALQELHRKLNSPPGERVEHHTIQLSYRYPPRNQNLFQYVIILFSRYNNRPLLVEIASKSQGTSLVDNLKKKYGEPETVIDAGSPGNACYWKRQNDFLIVSATPDRYGQLIFRIKIYFANNIRELIEKENRSDQKGQNGTKNAGEKEIF